MKRFFWITIFVLIIAATPATGQTEIKLVPQSYHTDQIETIKFCPDGSKMATGGKDKSIKVWDVRSSRLICTFSGYLFKVTGFSFSPDGKYLVSEGDMRALKLWNISTGKEEDFFRNKELMIDFTHGIAFDSTGNYLVTSNQKGDLKLFDFTTRKLIKTLKGPEGKTDLLGFCGSNKKIYAFSHTAGGRVINIENGKIEVNIATPATVTKIAYNPSANIYAFGHKDGTVEVKDNLHKVIKKLQKSVTPVSDLQFSGNGKYLIAEYGMYNYLIFNTTDYKQEFNEARIVNYSFGAQDTLAGIAYKNGLVKILNTKNNENTEIQNQHQLHTVMDINSNFGYCALLKQDNTVSLNLLSTGTEVKTLKSLTNGYPLQALFTADNQLSVLYSTGNAYNFSFSNLKQTTQTKDIFEEDNFRRGDEKYTVSFVGKSMQVINKETRNIEFKYTTQEGILNHIFSHNNEYIYALNRLKKLEKISIVAKRKVYEMSDPSGLMTQESEEVDKKFPLLETKDGNYILHTGEKFSIHIRNADGKIFKSLYGHTDHIHSLAFDSTEQKLVSASEDGSVIIWDWKNGEKLVSLLASDENWMVVTPENYYFNNKEGYQLVGFKIKDKAVPFEQFDIEYNRPDKVLEKMGGDKKWIQCFYLAHLKRIKKEGIKGTINPDELINMPEITIKNSNLLPLQTNKETLDFTVKVTGDGIAGGKLAVWVNGVPEVPTINKSLVINNKEAKVKITLSPGVNKVRVAYINKGGIESIPEIFETKYIAAKPTKPNLYVLCIGVSEYKNPDMNLRYAAKDSRDLAAQFKTANGFAKIQIDTLLDKKATLENILGWKKKLITAKVDDMVIVCLSGHGLLDDSMNFYFATHDIDFKSPAKRGLAYEDMEGLLAGIAPRRRLLMLDACHSGEADKAGLEEITENIELASGKKGTIKTYRYRTSELLTEVENEKIVSPFDLMSEMFTNLNKGSGNVVISAAAGNSYALEADEWENGVFTFSVLEALKNKTADYNQDGKISVAELRKYITNNVSTLTNNRQKPTSRAENTDADWVVWE